MNRTRLIRFAVGFAVLAMLAYLARDMPVSLSAPRVSPLLVITIFALYYAMRALNGLMMKLALAALGYVVTLGEAVMLAILTTYANLLLPRAGLGLPAVYLKTTRAVPYADFTSQALIVTTLQVGVIGACGLICQAILTQTMGVRFDPLVAALFGFALVSGIGAPLVKPTLFPDSHSPVANFLHRIAAAWGRIGSSRATVLALLLWNVPMLVLRAWRLQLCFHALGVSVPFLGAFIASLLADLIFFVSVTPGGLGFREAAITYSSNMLGTDPGVALTASILDRVIWTAGVVLIAQVGMWRMIRPALRAAREGIEQPPSEVKVASTLEAQ